MTAVPPSRATLVPRPAPVRPGELRALEGALARVTAGAALVVRSGDPTEDPDDRTPLGAGHKVAVLDLPADAPHAATGEPGGTRGARCPSPTHRTVPVAEALAR
ncbi:hypothetical protein ACFXAZ_23535 [Streptomyces sp. NPDC059477]|uniref:hypothetical protein n=1 Tax=Streptomyces sp. NPDC059477 TaxID=3346847 RepID=UPI0036A13497